MTIRLLHTTVCATLVATTLLAASSASAQDASFQEASDFSATGSATAASASADNEAVFRAFALHARSERTKRFIKAGSGIVLGGAVMGIAPLLEAKVGEDPKYYYIVGGISVGVGVLTLFMPSPAEKMARRYNVYGTGHSESDASSLESSWELYANRARSARYIGAAVTTLIGLGGVGAGIAIAAGAGNMSDTAQATWGSLLILGGAGMIAPGVGSFFLPSAAEASYATYMAGKASQVTAGLSLWGAPGGGMIGAAGSF